jgi:hypothetical protein
LVIEDILISRRQQPSGVLRKELHVVRPGSDAPRRLADTLTSTLLMFTNSRVPSASRRGVHLILDGRRTAFIDASEERT